MRRAGRLVVELVLAMAPCVAALALPVAAQAQEPGRPDIRALEQALVAAMQERDQPRLERLLTADYVLRSAPDIDRQTWIKNAITFCWGDRSDLDDFGLQVHDDVAIATFALTFYQDPVTCRPAVMRSVLTDIWVRQPDGWRLRLRNSAPPPSPNAGVMAQYGAVPLPPPTWDISSELSFVATGGNTSTRTLGIGSDVRHRSGANTTRGVVSFLSSQADTVVSARAVSVQLRQAFNLRPGLQVYGEGAYSRDRFAGIAGRTAATAGFAYTAGLPKPHSLTIEAGSGVEREQRIGEADRRFASASGAAHYVWTIALGTRLTQDAAVNADLQNGRNWRGTSVTAFSVAVSQGLSLRASQSFEYRNAPVPTFGRTDLRTAVALVLSLQRRPPFR